MNFRAFTSLHSGQWSSVSLSSTNYNKNKPYSFCVTSWSWKEKHNLQMETRIWRWFETQEGEHFHLTDGRVQQRPAVSLRVKFYRATATVTLTAQLFPPQAQLGSYSNQAGTFTVQSFTEPVYWHLNREPRRRRWVQVCQNSTHVFHLRVAPETNWYPWKLSASLRTSEMQYCLLKATLSSYRPREL